MTVGLISWDWVQLGLRSWDLADMDELGLDPASIPLLMTLYGHHHDQKSSYVVTVQLFGNAPGGAKKQNVRSFKFHFSKNGSRVYNNYAWPPLKLAFTAFLALFSNVLLERCTRQMN